MVGPGKIVDTVVFLDIDGVLNIGVKDQKGAPLLLNQSNVDYANAKRGGLKPTTSWFGGRQGLSGERLKVVERIVEFMDHDLGSSEETGTYHKFTCGNECHVSPVLVERMAQIVDACGDNRSMVLSSNWRRPMFEQKKTGLEEKVSKLLNKPFFFDATTRQQEEKTPGDRLACIGEYVEGLYAEGGAVPSRTLRILVLEDFFINPLQGWSCEGREIRCAGDVEEYLRQRAPKGADLAVKLIHPYDEWTTSTNMRMQVGAGLKLEDVREAEDFLARTSPVTSETSSSSLGKALHTVHDLTSLLHCLSPHENGALVKQVMPWITTHLPCTV